MSCKTLYYKLINYQRMNEQGSTKCKNYERTNGKISYS
jgi:hypothetical protein